MAASLNVRKDNSASDLRAYARRSADAQQVRRLLAVASILDGGTRSEEAKIGGVRPVSEQRNGALNAV